MDFRHQELSTIMNDLNYADFFAGENFSSAPGLRESHVDQSHSRDLSFDNIHNDNFTSPPFNDIMNVEGNSEKDNENISEMDYIRRMLLEKDIDDKVSSYQHEAALLATEKSFSDIISQKCQPLADKSSMFDSQSQYVDSNDAITNSRSFHLESRYDISATTSHSSEEPFIGIDKVPNLFSESISSGGFEIGVAEAPKFLPSNDKLMIALDANRVSTPEMIRTNHLYFNNKGDLNEKEVSANDSRGRKKHGSEDLEIVEGRCNKQPVFGSMLANVKRETLDMFLLYQEDKLTYNINELQESMKNELTKNSHNNGDAKSSGSKKKAKGKKQETKDVVDLGNLLIYCAQALANDERKICNELLKQIRQHSSPLGDGSQRLAHWFANGLEARLTGTGSQIYKSLLTKTTNATNILKAYHLYLAACPFKKISHFFSNQTILNVAAKASKLHIIDFGIFYGFQWPCLIQSLASRDQGPPKLRITGIDVSQPGFYPSKRIEETGHRLAEYARDFNVPFEYHAIASKWETIQVEDLNIHEDEFVIVNCLYRFRNLVDETVIADSPRNRVLATIKKINPAVFIHGIVNGTYSAPVFFTRFREALFHYSSLFDMLENNIPRDNEERLLIERDLFAREALNIIACEGPERVERPETYKYWQNRNLRAKFTQLTIDPDIMKKAKEKARVYHKDFFIDDDNRWLLLGWKGRIVYAISGWKPNSS